MQTVVTEINFYFYIVEYVGFYIILYAWEYCARRSGGVAVRNAFYTSSLRKTRVRLVHTTRYFLDALFEYNKLETQFKRTAHVGTAFGGGDREEVKIGDSLISNYKHTSDTPYEYDLSHDGWASKVVKVFGPLHDCSVCRVINLKESGGGGGDGFTTQFRANPRAGTIFIAV